MASRTTPPRPLFRTLLDRVPKGASLPSGLEAVLSAWAAAEWGGLGFVNLGEADAAPLLDLKPALQKRVLAFASVSCGDQLTLWWAEVSAPPRVVIVGAHGEAPIVFADLADFLVHLVEARTTVHDLDEGNADPDRRSALLSIPRGPCSGPSPELATEFSDWLLANRPKGRPLDPKVMESLRAEIVGIVHREAAAQTGFERWEPGDVYRQWRLEADAGSGSLIWFSGGPKEFPGKAAIWPAIHRLLVLTGQTGKPARITVDSEGRLFPDVRTTIEPPAA